MAEKEEQVIGHVLLSAVSIENGSALGLGLAPVAVLPMEQGRGIGSELIKAGLNQAKEAGYALVVVLGEPDFYRRFGFVKASQFGLTNEYGVDDPFMVVELKPGELSNARGLVKYPSEFAMFEP